jgi:hypothetical protein
MSIADTINPAVVSPIILSNAALSSPAGSSWGLLVNTSGLAVTGSTLSTALNVSSTTLRSGSLPFDYNVLGNALNTANLAYTNLYTTSTTSLVQDWMTGSSVSPNTHWQTFAGSQEAAMIPAFGHALYNYFSSDLYSIVVSTHPSYAEKALSWKVEIAEEIANYVSRAPGWDGYNAQTIRPQAIYDAIEFVSALPDDIERPRDMPCSDGEVSLVWRDGDRYAEVSFPGNRTFYWYATDGRREAGNDDVPIGNGLPEQLQEIIGIGIISTSIAPIPHYATALLEAA